MFGWEALWQMKVSGSLVSSGWKPCTADPLAVFRQNLVLSIWRGDEKYSRESEPSSSYADHPFDPLHAPDYCR